MTYLNQLSPAEVYILTQVKLSHKELLKVTFIDLLLKNVLNTFEIKRQPHAKEAVRTYQYIGTGANFKNYQAKNHEKFFLSIFEKEPAIGVLFSNLVKVGYQQSRTLSDFKNELIKTPILKKCFTQNIWHKMFYGYKFTDYGKDLKRKVEKEIQQLNAELLNSHTPKNQMAVELIKVIGGNIFILETIDYELLKQIKLDLGSEFTRKENHTDAGGCSGCAYAFDNYSSGFDSGCSSDSGCGGDSGCSGCSGCGGCSS